MAECAEAVLSLQFYDALLIIGQDAKDVSFSIAYNILGTLHIGCGKSTSCYQSRFLEISGVWGQEDSSVGEALALQA